MNYEGATMRDEIRAVLAPVRRRCWAQMIVRAALLGLLAGALVSGVLTLASLRWPGPAWQPAALVALLAGPALGALVGACRRPGWQAVATAVDVHCGLKDRATAALDFAAQANPTVFERCEIWDALRHLTALDPRRVAPVRLPRGWPLAAAASAAALALLVWALLTAPAAAEPPEPLPDIVAEADLLEEHAREMEAAAKELASPELKKLAEQLRQKVEELKQPGVDPREALAKLSELQAALAAQQKEFDVPLVNQQLKQLGQALDGPKAFEGTAKALQKEQFDKAAKEMTQAAKAKLNDKEAQATRDSLKQAAKQMKDKGLHKLSKATSQMSEGLLDDQKKLEQGTRDLAKEIRDHDRRRRIQELMAKEQERLNDCKSRCEQQARNLFNRNSNPNSKNRQQNQQQNQQAQKKGGHGENTRPQGPKDNTSPQDKDQLKGKAGDGPSEVETEKDGEPGPQRARRPQRDVYQKYRQMSEAALDAEPVPLGHRQAIRRYFELIRPPGADADKKDGSKR
jgi:hypothetical protein